MDKLEPCPFCGEDVTIEQRDKLFVFKCPDHSPCIGVGFATYGVSDLKKCAIDAWNNRTPPLAKDASNKLANECEEYAASPICPGTGARLLNKAASALRTLNYAQGLENAAKIADEYAQSQLNFMKKEPHNSYAQTVLRSATNIAKAIRALPKDGAQADD